MLVSIRGNKKKTDKVRKTGIAWFKKREKTHWNKKTHTVNFIGGFGA